MNAEELYNALLNEGVKNLRFCGLCKVGNFTVNLSSANVVGNIIQEWLEGWLKKNEVEYSPNPNTQMPPDIYLNPNDKENDLLEVKAFNYKASPGFDIADFNAYQHEIISEPYMLFVRHT